METKGVHINTFYNIILYTGCTYNGHTHMMGEKFNSVDGCNTCHCQEDGTYMCTTEACMPSK